MESQDIDACEYEERREMAPEHQIAVYEEQQKLTMAEPKLTKGTGSVLAGEKTIAEHPNLKSELVVKLFYQGGATQFVVEEPTPHQLSACLVHMNYLDKLVPWMRHERAVSVCGKVEKAARVRASAKVVQASADLTEDELLAALLAKRASRVKNEPAIPVAIAAAPPLEVDLLGMDASQVVPDTPVAEEAVACGTIAQTIGNLLGGGKRARN